MSDAPTSQDKEGPKPVAAQSQGQQKPPPEFEDVPDPDEDDLDDLDDMLDDFSAAKIQENKSAEPSGSAPSAVPGASENENVAADKGLDDILGDDDFAKQLQAGMTELLGELEKNPEMQSQFDDMFKQISGAANDAMAEDDTAAAAASASAAASGAPSASSSAAQPTPPTSATDAKATDASFQETIRRTMERMQASGDQATAAAAESSTDDLLTEMMKQFGGEGGGGAGSEEDFSKMLMGMMEQLTNKEILYEPMKELHEKFPGWLEKNRDKTPAEDLKRYEEQQVLVKEIVGKFEEKTYSDSNAADREYIVQRMQKMQDSGSPPSDLVGDMESAQEAFNMPDESCNPQ